MSLLRIFAKWRKMSRIPLSSVRNTQCCQGAAVPKVKDMTEILSGQDLIDAGMQQGKWFGKALAAANAVLENGGSQGDALEVARAFAPPPALKLHAADSMPLHLNIEAETPDEAANVEAVTRQHGRADAHAGDPRRRHHAGCLPDRSVGHDSGRRRRGVGGDPSRHAFGRHLLLDGDLGLSRSGAGDAAGCRPCGHPFRAGRTSARPADPAGQGGLRAFRGQPLAARPDQCRDRAFRHAGRRQPFRLCRHVEVERRDGAGHPSRLALAGRAALQQGHEDRRGCPQVAVAGNLAAERLDSGRHAGRR